MAVSLTKIPKTPAEVAGAVLDAIERQPSAFDMSSWVDVDRGDFLRPGDSLCGTTMCAAGWAAHLTGWTLHRTLPGELVEIEYNGSPDETDTYAEKDGVRCLIEDVAEEALDLDPETETFWYGTPEHARVRLHEIAGRA